MTKEELRTKLRQEGIPENWYSLENAGNRDQKICLDNQSRKWVVYYSERGAKLRLKDHNSENAACEDVYNRLTDWYESDKRRKNQ